MASVGLDVLFGITLAVCNQHSSQVPGFAKGEIAGLEQSLKSWAPIACEQYRNLGEDIEIELISTRLKGHEQSERQKFQNMKGVFSFEKARRGRIKMLWQVPKNDVRVEAWANLKVYENAWVFNENVHPYQRIKARMMVQQRTEVSRLGEAALLSPLDQALLSSRQVRRGDVLSVRNARHVPMIFKNESVDITLQSGSITVYSEGKALEFGWENGDSVRVRATNSEGPVMATVSGRNKVVVEN